MGAFHQYFQYQLISFIDPFKRKRGRQNFDGLFDKATEKLEKLKAEPERIRQLGGGCASPGNPLPVRTVLWWDGRRRETKEVVMVKRGIALSVGALLIGGVVLASGLQASEHNRLSARLLGENEVCAVAECNDPNGSGHAAVRMKPAERRICFSIRWRRIEAPYAAHIHSGEAGAEGPVEVTLFSATELSTSVKSVGGCARAPGSLIDAIKENPGGYYVNVHTPAYEGGAIRGQLRQ